MTLQKSMVDKGYDCRHLWKIPRTMAHSTTSKPRVDIIPSVSQDFIMCQAVCSGFVCMIVLCAHNSMRQPLSLCSWNNGGNPASQWGSWAWTQTFMGPATPFTSCCFAYNFLFPLPLCPYSACPREILLFFRKIQLSLFA